MLFNIKTEKSKLVLIWAIKELMGSDCLSVQRRGLSLVSARKSFDLLSVLAMGAKEGGQREGIVFNIPNLIQSFTLKTRNVMPTKNMFLTMIVITFQIQQGRIKPFTIFLMLFFFEIISCFWQSLLLMQYCLHFVFLSGIIIKELNLIHLLILIFLHHAFN